MISSFAHSGATAKRENKNLILSCQSDAQDRALWRSMRPHSQIRVSIQIMEGYCGPGKPRQRRSLTAQQDWPSRTLRLRALVASRPCMARCGGSDVFWQTATSGKSKTSVGVQTLHESSLRENSASRRPRCVRFL